MEKEDLILDKLKDLKEDISEIKSQVKNHNDNLIKLEYRLNTVEDFKKKIDCNKEWYKKSIISVPLSVITTILVFLVKGYIGL